MSAEILPKRPVRVLQVVTQLERAGAQTLAAWIQGTVAHQRLLVDTLFLYNKSGSDQFTDSSVLLQRRPKNLMEGLRLLQKLRHRVEGSDIVLAHTHYAIALACLLTPRAKTVVAVHHWPIERYPAACRVAVTLSRRVRKRFCEIAVSETVEPRASGFEVIPNPVPTSWSTKSSTRQVPPAADDILVVARHAPEKRLDTLLACMTRLPNRRATLIGTGELERALQEQARDFGVASRVKFAGAVPRDEVLSRMRACSCLVLPSAWEAMPMVILEAVAADVPIVVSNIDAHRFAADAGAVLVFEVGDSDGLASQISNAQRGETRAALSSGRAVLRERQSEQAIATRWRRVLDTI